MDSTLSLEAVVIASLPLEEQWSLKAGYLGSFPPDEQRNWTELLRPLPDTLSTLVVRHGGEAVGLLSYWELGAYIYVEHFFLAPSVRSLGLGGQTLELLRGRYPDRALLLEAEPEGASPMAGRRLGFYGRMGFGILPIDYIQPPYREDSSAVSLHLLCTQALDEAESQRLAQLLYRKVYGR